MHILRKIALILCLGALPFAAACSPTVICLVETQVLPDYTCRRSTRMEIHPNPRYPNQRFRLGDYFHFPPAELYDAYNVLQEKVHFSGTFASYEKIPSDIVRPTPGAQALAGNLFSFRVMDLVLFVLADFDETMTDIVKNQQDGEAALDELLRLVVPEVMSVLNARYGSRYDLSRLEAWLMNDLPHKLKRVYNGAWAIHAAKRSGVTSPGEEFEYYVFLMSEAKREGFELVDPGTPNMQQENVRRLKEYGIKLAESLCPPRQPGGPGVGQEMLGGSGAVDELLAAVQKAVVARHGSINNFIGKISALVPRAFGTYLTGAAMPFYMLPETTYRHRLRTPGRVLQTNGVIDVNGDIVWTFADRDLAFTGQAMWARTLFIREPIAAALGVKGFPSSLEDVDRFFSLCLGPTGEPREELLNALQRAAMARSLAEVEGLAANPSSQDAQAARGVIEFLNRFKQSGNAVQARNDPLERLNLKDDPLAPMEALSP